MFDDVVRCTVQELPKINWFEDDVLSLSLAPIISNAPKIGAREIIILERMRTAALTMRKEDARVRSPLARIT